MQSKNRFKEATQKVGSKAQDFYNKARSYVGGVFKPGTAGTPSQIKRDRLKELLERMDGSRRHLDPVLVPQELQDDFHSVARMITVQGFHDGVVRQPSAGARHLAEARSADLHLRCIGMLAAREEELSIEAQSQKEVLEDKRRQVSLHHDYQNYLQHHNKFNERGNTIGEFVLYLICSFLIFVADIPLASEMLKWLLTVPTAADQPFSLFNIHRADLNTFLTAIGIGLSTIYVKIWYDKFVARKYGHSIIAKKKFEALFDKAPFAFGVKSDSAAVDNTAPGTAPAAPSAETLTPADKEAIKRNERIIRIIEVALLVFTLITIAMLGIFRSYAWRAIKEDEYQVPMAVSAATLILVTLLFSVVSGVCLSISLSSLTTYRRLKNCRNEGIALENSFIDKSKNIAVLEGKGAYIKKVSAAVSDESRWKHMVCCLLMAYYESGYKEGTADLGYFMQGLDFFDRLLRWREEAIAGKINTQLN